MPRETVLIIGAGPAGLTAAYELLNGGKYEVIILEKSNRIGGISCTINHNGNRMDLGGHRFFSKSQRVMDWWQNMLPIENIADGQTVTYHGKSTPITKNNQKTIVNFEDVLLVRKRISRIYFLRKFFDYPLKLSVTTVQNLGVLRTLFCGLSYLKALLFPRFPEKTLEDFLINRFGVTLYRLFFKSYTHKVWGRECSEINADWGRQRIKGLSIGKAIIEGIKKPFKKETIEQKSTETSLIEKFLYPKYGPGQMWETCAKRIKEYGGEIHLGHNVISMEIDNKSVVQVVSICSDEIFQWKPDFVISSMPVCELIDAIKPPAPLAIQEISKKLPYRDFLTIGLLVPSRSVRHSEKRNAPLQDNWIYIQEPDVLIGRLQIFNNWSPAMVADPQNTMWLGLEYFCKEDDDLWSMSDEDLVGLGIKELRKIGILKMEKFLDYRIIRVPKAYPAYFGTYNQLNNIRSWTDPIQNLFLVGRNGMHRYNNQDHSMLSAMEAAECISSNSKDKSKIWNVNQEGEYHEER